MEIKLFYFVTYTFFWTFLFGVVLWDFSNVKYVPQKVWKTVSGKLSG